MLWIFGYGYRTSPFLKLEIDGKQYYCNNDAFSYRFFPRALAREFDPFRFSATKSENTYRIFILGASAAQGTPDGAYGFGRILEAMLREANPQTRFEVINLSLTAINSHVVRDLAESSLAHQPDLLIVYLGNNEVVGPFGPGNTFRDFSPRYSYIRIHLALRKTKLGQLLGNITERLSSSDKTPMEWKGMEIFTKNQIRADDPRLERVYDYFARNLEAMCESASQRNCPMILCTVGSNVKDCAPFGSQHRSGLKKAEQTAWNEAYQEAAALEKEGDRAGARTAFLQAIEIDGSYAELCYRLGRNYEQEGQFESALDYYTRARDQDTLRFRADSRINATIRTTARHYADQGIYLLDAEELFSRASSHGLVGESIFYEHVHMNFHGNYLLAHSLCERIRAIAPKLFPAKESASVRMLTEEECAKRLVFSIVSRHNISATLLDLYLKKPPFTRQWNYANWIAQKEQELRALAEQITPTAIRSIQKEYEQALEHQPEDFWLRWRYTELLSSQLYDTAGAIPECKKVLQQFPHFRRGYEMLGLIYSDARQYDMALKQFEKVREINPASYSVLYHIGKAYQDKGDTATAENYYKELLAKRPDHVGATIQLGLLLQRRGALQEALEVFRQGITCQPRHAKLHYFLAQILVQQGKTSEAIEHLKTAATLDPDSPQIRQALNALTPPQSVHPDPSTRSAR